MSKSQVREHFDQLAKERDHWRRFNNYYYHSLARLLKRLIPSGQRVLEIGCGTGDLLASIEPGHGVGMDLSLEMTKIARRKYPDLTFLCADAEALPLSGEFDYVIVSDLIGHLSDVWVTFDALHQVCGSETQVIITYYNFLWQPILNLAEKLRLKMLQNYQNWLQLPDIEGLLSLTDFEVQSSGRQMLLPFRIPWLSELANRYWHNLPLLDRLCLQIYTVAEPKHPRSETKPYSCTVLIPCRNEIGNIDAAVERVPTMGTHTEILFVDGNSTDGTPELIETLIEKYRGQKDIKLIHQVSPDTREKQMMDRTAADMMLSLGKGDAVRKGFDQAMGDVLMILDADLTVPPEDLPKFFLPIAQGKTQFVNGTRLVYPMEKQAMKLLNYLGNHIFSLVFTWLLGQRIKDTLCGTKVLLKRDYDQLKEGRSYFGDFDPFGDFDLLFGATRLGLKIIEVPVRYRQRLAGESKVRVFQHGILLIRMSLIGFYKLKWLPWLARLRGKPSPTVVGDLQPRSE